MPTTLGESTFALFALAALLALIVAMQRRWGTGVAADPVDTVWRWIQYAAEDSGRSWFRRRASTEAPPVSEPDGVDAGSEPVEAPAGPPPPPPPPPSGRPRIDHVPFSVGARADEGDERFRDRFRRGLRKTRDVLNRDVREVFGSGPVEESFDSLEEILVRADVGVATATTLADELRNWPTKLAADTMPPALKEVMRRQLSDADRRLRVNPEGVSVWLVVGVNGTGKTTTIAKLAQHASSQGFRVSVAAADTFRAAAIEQLSTWAERVGVDIIKQRPGADPAAVAFDAVAHAKARNIDLVIVDTAGRLHTRKPLMEELSKVRRVIEKEPGVLTEALLVLDATTGQNGISQAKAFGDAVEVTGLVLAKLDGTAKGGIAFSVERELGVPVKAIGTGESADDLAPFDPDMFVEALFGER